MSDTFLHCKYIAGIERHVNHDFCSNWVEVCPKNYVRFHVFMHFFLFRTCTLFDNLSPSAKYVAREKSR
jgi:hypothetical protein